MGGCGRVGRVEWGLKMGGGKGEEMMEERGKGW